MTTTTIFTPEHPPNPEQRETILDFLFVQLDQYGDKRDDIAKCMAYAMKETESFGGVIVCVEENEQLLGVSIVNHTGMGGYIPENILVYIATHKDARGKGIGKSIIDTICENTEGDIALHVEPENPARYLYEKKGFTNKYLEMRLKKA